MPKDVYLYDFYQPIHEKTCLDGDTTLATVPVWLLHSQEYLAREVYKVMAMRVESKGCLIMCCSLRSLIVKGLFIVLQYDSIVLPGLLEVELFFSTLTKLENQGWNDSTEGMSVVWEHSQPSTSYGLLSPPEEVTEHRHRSKP